MNEVNKAIFDGLTEFSAGRGVSTPAGSRRIFLERLEFDALASSQLLHHFPIARRQAAALIGLAGGGEILAVAGFEADELVADSSLLREIDVSPGLGVAALHDLAVEPRSSALEVLNVVAFGVEGKDNYSGHQFESVKSLFPTVRVFDVDTEIAGLDNLAANLLILCAGESVQGNSWVRRDLASELVRLADQRISGLPYEFLVMATLDVDPKNLFLALYRCLEATYAYTRASELVSKLGITNKSWLDVAQALGESLSWYPRHDQSLANILALSPVRVADLNVLAVSLGKAVTGDDLPTRVSTGLRELRNSLVHYGPTSRPAINPTDWNDLCEALARVVGCVLSHTHGPGLVGGLSKQTVSPVPLFSTSSCQIHDLDFTEEPAPSRCSRAITRGRRSIQLAGSALRRLCG